MQADLTRRVAAEALGTAFLLAAVVGSGIMGERLAGGNVAIALLANTAATVAALIALILTFGPISGAHFNPAVTIVMALRRDCSWPDVPFYLAAQLFGTGGIAALLLLGAASGQGAVVDVALTLALLAAFASIAFVKAAMPPDDAQMEDRA